MCNPNIQNNILNWLNKEIKKYENFKNAGGGGGLSLVVSWVWKIPKLHASCC